MINVARKLGTAAGRHLTESGRAVLERTFRTHAFSRLMERDYAAVSAQHSGQWLNRITSDTAVIAATVTSLLPEIAGTLVRLLGALSALIVMMPRLTLILLPCGLLMLVTSYLLRKRLKLLHAKAQEADGSSRSFMQERIAGLLVIRTFSREKSAAQQADELERSLVDAKMRRARLSVLSGTAVSGVLMGAQFLGVALCGWGIAAGTMSYGTMSAVLYLINMLEAPFARLSGYLSQYYAMVASAERLMEIETLPADPFCALQERSAEDFDLLGMDGVSFLYPDSEPVLENVSFTVKKGSFTAFTGSSGAGKSTAMKLLLGLYRPQNGKVFLHAVGEHGRELSAADRGLFAYVPQGNLLLSGTVREAVAFSDPVKMADEDAIRRALEISCAWGFVSSLPRGLDTPLGEGGSGLSEGQQQRLSIARALISGRPVLLLDEATSALDAQTEAQLLRNLRTLTDRTVIIITHRTAVLDCCDSRIRFDTHSDSHEDTDL